MELISEILVKDFGILELNTKEVEDFGIPLTFNINDIKDISSRKASFSKTIKVPGTKANNVIFNHLYEIKGTDFSWDYRNKYDCILMVNKNPVMVGYLTLKKITKLFIQGRYEIVYEIVIFNEVKNFFQDIKGLKLKDLDFSSGFTFMDTTYSIGDHILNETNICDSSNHTFQDVYTYPLIDYGYADTALSTGSTYIFGFQQPIGFKDYPRTALVSNIIYPVTYLRPVIDKIFYDAGYEYDSNFLSGLTYSGLTLDMAIGFNQAKEYVNLHLCEYTTDATIIYDSDPQIIELEKGNCVLSGITTLYYNIDDYFNNGYIKVPYDGDYILKIRLHAGTDTSGTISDPAYYGIPGAQVCAEASQEKLYCQITNVDEDITLLAEYETYDLRPDAWSGSTNYYFEDEIYFDAKKEDKIILYYESGQQIEWDPIEGCSYINSNLDLNGLTLELILNRVENIEEQYTGTTTPTIRINEILPDMSQEDFMKNIIKMFNLYIEYDNENNKLKIEPRDDYYKAGTILNWDEKVDWSKEIDVYSLNDQIGDKFYFNYLLGEDFFNTNYFGTYGETWGNKIIDVESNYIENIIEVNLDFQSYHTDFKQIGIGNTNIIRLKESTEHTWFDDRSEFKPYVMCVRKDAINYTGFRFGNLVSGTTRNPFYYIPMTAAHYQILDGSNLTTFDLNFETRTGYTTLNTDYSNFIGLYDVFWKNSILNIINEASRRVELYCNLTIEDIIDLNFRDRIWIDYQLYYLEKIEYDPSSKDPAKVILIKEVEPLEVGEFVYYYLLKNDSGDYILTNTGLTSTYRIQIN